MTPAGTPIVNESNPKLEQFVTELNQLLARYQYDIKIVLIYEESGIRGAMRIADVVPAVTPEVTPPTPSVEPTIETPMETPVFPSINGGTPDGQ